MPNNTQLLRLMNLPVFSNADELAELMHVDSSLLKEIQLHPHRYYKKYRIRKSSGGTRQIKQPSKTVKAIQAWILRFILGRLTPSIYATAYIKGKGLLDGVSLHKNNRYFLCIDIEEFFPSISERRVTSLFILIGYCGKVATLLSKLCTCSGCLPEGAITSPAVSNLIASKLDRRIGGYASRRNITYTRYSDDITLSSNNSAMLCKALPMVTTIIKSEHFKPHKINAVGPRIHCRIIGLIKNSREPKFGIGRKKKREMRTIMHHLLSGKGAQGKYKTQESIEGWLSYLNSVDSESFSQMFKYWNHLKNSMA